MSVGRYRLRFKSKKRNAHRVVCGLSYHHKMSVCSRLPNMMQLNVLYIFKLHSQGLRSSKARTQDVFCVFWAENELNIDSILPQTRN